MLVFCWFSVSLLLVLCWYYVGILLVLGWYYVGILLVNYPCGAESQNYKNDLLGILRCFLLLFFLFYFENKYKLKT